MPELIDRHALLKKVYEHPQERERMTDGEWCRKCIYEAPTIDAEPVRHGRWLQYSRNTEETYIECSECCVSSRPRHLQMVTRTGSGLPDYCPNCGARMDGGVEND